MRGHAAPTPDSAVRVQRPPWPAFRNNQTGSKARLACDCHFDLLLSTFITERRWDDDPDFRAHRHRFDRLDVFMYALRSYAALPIRRAYIYIELDRAFRSRKAELASVLRSTLGARMAILRWERPTTQRAWRRELRTKIAPNESAAENDPDRILWFLQNDDHVFVDVNDDVLCEGVALLRNDRARFRTIYPSHWASAMNLVGKVAPPVQRGSYVISSLTQLDSVQFMNFGFLRFLLSDLDWRGKAYPRVDMLIRQRRIYGASASMAQLYATDRSLQNFYVPLRELCRKFDAYTEFRIPLGVAPALVLPSAAAGQLQPRRFAPAARGKAPRAARSELCQEIDCLRLFEQPPGDPLARDPARMALMMRSAGASIWSRNNPFTVPDAWVTKMLTLYRVAELRHQLRRCACGAGPDTQEALPSPEGSWEGPAQAAPMAAPYSISSTISSTISGMTSGTTSGMTSGGGAKSKKSRTALCLEMESRAQRRAARASVASIDRPTARRASP